MQIELNYGSLPPLESPSEQRAAEHPFIFPIPDPVSEFHALVLCHLRFELSLVHAK